MEYILSELFNNDERYSVGDTVHLVKNTEYYNRMLPAIEELIDAEIIKVKSENKLFLELLL